MGGGAPGGLHVVYGANEAGKSTALRAVRDLLYGFEHRTRDSHRFDHLKLAPDECEAAQGPLRAIIANMDIAVQFGAGTPGQIAERVAMLLDDGMCDYICFMFPAGDMTFAESRRTLELFVSEVQPQLEQQTTTTR